MKRTLLKAFLCNLLLVACGVALLLLVGDRLILIWAGAAEARKPQQSCRQLCLARH